MSLSLTRAILIAPWIASLLWLVLQGAAWSLALRGAALRKRMFERAGVDPPSPHELNPFFRRDVERRRFASPRFLVSWLGFAGLLYAWIAVVEGLAAVPAATLEWGLGVLLGVLVFTRCSLILQHLRNIAVLGRVLQMSVPTALARTQLDLQSNLGLQAVAMGSTGLLLGVAALLTWDPWIVGGTLGQLLLAGKYALLAWRTARRGPRDALAAA